MTCARLLVAMMVVARAANAQLPPVIVADAGPGPVGRHLIATLAIPGTRVLMGDTIAIHRDSIYAGSVVAIARQVTVRGEVRGDLIVVGGDLVMKPLGRVAGDGISIGGGTYPSMLGSARSLTSHRDFTYDAERTTSNIVLRYRELRVPSVTPIVSLGATFGLRIPSYDRSRGLSLPVGPTITLNDGRLTFDALATYRSQLGKIDPSIRGEWKTGRKFWLSGYAGRESRTNDAWITGELSNSVNVLLFGRDTRNWYRATAGELFANRMFETPTMTSVYRIGAQVERASSTRPDSFAMGGPWSFTGRKSSEGIRRPNPQVGAGDVTSMIGGANYRWTAGDLKARLDGSVEIPVSTSNNARFIYTTIDGQIAFPTFGTQRYKFETHAILTLGDTAPRQRFGYLGGSGTLSTEDLLVFGGDELLFFESRYEIPLDSVKLPLVGKPTVMLRHILGSTGIQSLPNFTQIVGLRLSVPFLRVQLMMDTRTRKKELSGGLALTR